jgi:hypothetical protein
MGANNSNNNGDDGDGSNVLKQHINVNRYESIPSSGNWNNLIKIALDNQTDKYNLPEFRYTLGASELERNLRDPTWWESDNNGKFLNAYPIKIQPSDKTSIELLQENGEPIPTEWTPTNAYKLFDGIKGIKKTILNGQTVIAGQCRNDDPDGKDYVDCPQAVYVPGCPIGYTSSYRCGDSDSNKTVNISSDGDGAWLKTAIYDCNSESNKCLDVKLILSDSGYIQIQQGKDFYNVNTNRIPATAIAMDKYKYDKGIFKRNYLAPGDILPAVDDLTNVGNSFVGSQSGKCRLVLFRNANTFQLLLMYSILNCEKNSLEDYIGLNPTGDSTGISDYAIYSVPNIESGEVGQVAYISNDLQIRPYPAAMLSNGGTNYFSVGNYSSTDPLIGENNKPINLQNATLEQCKDECTNNNKCYGFSYNSKTKTGTLYGENMFGANPDGKRIFNEDLELFIRSKLLDNNISCSKKVNSITGEKWNSYIRGDPMSKDSLCQVADYIEDKRRSSALEGEKLNDIGTEMNTKLKDLTNQKEKLDNNMKFNIDRLSQQLSDYNEAQYELEHADKHNTNITAMDEDTYLRMQSENYQYLLWSILAILIIIYGIKNSRSK